MESGIYVIINTVNGKQYVGSSTVLSVRKRRHFQDLRTNTHVNKHLQAAWNKYGGTAFVFQVLEHCPLEQLIEREQYWIEKLDVVTRGYNIAPTAGSMFGYVHPPNSGVFARWANPAYREKLYRALQSPEARARVSEQFRQQWADPQRRERYIQQIRDRWADPEYKARVAASNRQAVADPAIRAAMSKRARERLSNPKNYQRMVESRRTPEARAQASQRTRQQWADPIERERLLQAFRDARARRQVEDPETHARLLVHMREIARNPENRARNSACAKQRWADPETRAKLLQARQEAAARRKQAKITGAT